MRLSFLLLEGNDVGNARKFLSNIIYVCKSIIFLYLGPSSLFYTYVCMYFFFVHLFICIPFHGITAGSLVLISLEMYYLINASFLFLAGQNLYKVFLVNVVLICKL